MGRDFASKGPEDRARDLNVDCELLPYSAEAIAFIKDWRGRGGKAVLVSAGYRLLAERISQFLGVFDEVLDTNATQTDRAGSNLRKDRSDGSVHLAGNAFDNRAQPLAPKIIMARDLRSHSVAPYIKALRPHQWIKNSLVFLPVLLAHQLTLHTGLQALLAFVAFSLVASGVYVLNDLLDLAADRAHPRKRKRPFAAGLIPLQHGTWMSPLLFCTGSVVALSLGSDVFLVLVGYMIVTTLYSISLKHRFILDICTLAGLYTLRVVAGAVATGTALSLWLLVFSVLFFFSLAAVKRQAELVGWSVSGQTLGKGRGYGVGDLGLVERLAIIAGALSVTFLAVYLNTPTVSDQFGNPVAIWGVCLILTVWLGRIILVTHRGGLQDDPVLFAVTDWVSWFCLGLVFLFMLSGNVS